LSGETIQGKSAANYKRRREERAGLVFPQAEKKRKIRNAKKMPRFGGDRRAEMNARRESKRRTGDKKGIGGKESY